MPSGALGLLGGWVALLRAVEPVDLRALLASGAMPKQCASDLEAMGKGIAGILMETSYNNEEQMVEAVRDGAEQSQHRTQSDSQTRVASEPAV